MRVHWDVLEVTAIESPVGPLAIAARDRRVCALWFGTERQVIALLGRWFPGQTVSPGKDPGGAVRALRAYFSGDLHALDVVEVELHGTTFQQRVWRQLRSLRAGTTATYAQIARAVGAPSAVRAVGAANGANPVSLIVPCHRVIGSNGGLTGYGGGLDRKRWLLEHESPARQARLL